VKDYDLYNLTNPNLAAMLRGYAVGRPDFGPLAEEIAFRLCAHSERGKKRGGAENAHSPRTNEGFEGSNAGNLRTEGGKGGGAFGSDALIGENQTGKAETNASPIQATLRARPEADCAENAQSPRLIQQDSRGWTPGFTRFYAAYPDGSKALTCARQWLSAGLEPDTDRILGGLELWKMSERWQTGHVLHMRNFLIERMWEQAPPAPKSTVTTNAASQAAPKFDRDAMLAAVDAENARRKAHGIKR